MPNTHFRELQTNLNFDSSIIQHSEYLWKVIHTEVYLKGLNKPLEKKILEVHQDYTKEGKRRTIVFPSEIVEHVVSTVPIRYYCNICRNPKVSDYHFC